MVAIWIGGALLLGLAVSRIGLPPLVGFLASGFVFAALGMERAPMLGDLAHAGVLLLLFAVGLKLRIKTLLRYEVWGTAISHLLVTGIIGVAAAAAGGWLAPGLALALAVSLRFLEHRARGEGARWQSRAPGRARPRCDRHPHRAGRRGRGPARLRQPRNAVAATRCCCCWCRSRARRSPGCSQRCGHGELLVLFGAALAIGGGEGFEALGLSAELGALLLGTMLADHKRSQELTNVLWSLKELFLVAFFLDIGFSGPPTWEALTGALWLVALLPLKGAIFFLLLIGLGLRARTSFLTAVSLTTYSEFALIVINVAVTNGLLGTQWVIVTALAVALSFIAAAPLNAFAHEIFRWASPWLERLERDKRHPDDEPISLGRAEILIVGMGRVGAGAYDYLRAQNENIVGIDSDPAKIESNVREGRRVAYADAEDPSFWHLLNIDRLRAIMLAVPDLAGQDIGGARVAAARLSRAAERDPPVSRGARADSRGRLRRDLQLLHRSRCRLRSPHLRDAAAVGRRCARRGEGREGPAVPVSAGVGAA